MESHTSFPCPRCQIGHCQPIQTTYVQMYGDQLISIPDVAAWRCDICGLQEFNPEALLHISKLLNLGNSAPEAPRTTSRTGEQKDIRPAK